MTFIKKTSTQTSIYFTNKVMMVRPACFGFNEETAVDNAFQTKILGISPAEISAKAIEEFDDLVAKLKQNKITVELIQDTKNPENPDAVFPNNWVSFHEPDYVITYPMLAKKRRTERRQSTIETIKEKYNINERYAYEKYEELEEYLEGTGSMVLDSENKIAYACRSERTSEKLFKQFCNEMNFFPILFNAKDKKETAIYHTNVMLCIGNGFAVICMEAIPNKEDRIILEKSFETTGKKIIDVSLEQMHQYAGNMIQLKNDKDKYFLVMSTSAYNSLNKEQIDALNLKTNIIHSNLTTIETFGGGSARCMIAEIFLNTRAEA